MLYASIRFPCNRSPFPCAHKLHASTICAVLPNAIKYTPPTRNSSSTSRFSFSLLLFLLLFLGLFLLLLILLLVLTLQILDLLFCLRDWLEEPLQSSLLRALQVLLQPSGTASNSVLTESLLGNQKLDEAFDVRGFPLEVAVWVIGWPDVGVEEELAGVGVGPVFWDLELGLSCLDSFNELFEGAVFADQLQSGVGTDFGDGV